MIDHISLAVRDLDVARAFDAAVLDPLGLRLIVERDATIGFGKTYPEFWLNLRGDMGPVAQDTGVHICLRAPDNAAVNAFYANALTAGGAGDGAPGSRHAAMTTYYGAFIKDPDGNKIEAVCFPRKS